VPQQVVAHGGVGGVGEGVEEGGDVGFDDGAAAAPLSRGGGASVAGAGAAAAASGQGLDVKVHVKHVAHAADAQTHDFLKHDTAGDDVGGHAAAA